MRLGWRSVVVTVGLSFGLGIFAAGHKVILSRLEQATRDLWSVQRPGLNTDRAASRGEATPDVASTPPKAAPQGSGNRTSPTLRTSPLPEDLFMPQRGDVRFIIMSDLNGPYRSTTYRQEVLQSIQSIPDWEPDLVLFAGDMVAGQLLSLTPEEMESMWAGFDRSILQPLRQGKFPVAIAMGQHDGSNQLLDEETKEQIARAQASSPVVSTVSTTPSDAANQSGANTSRANTVAVSAAPYIFAQERGIAQNYWSTMAPKLGLEWIESGRFPFRYSFIHNDIFVLVWDTSSAEVSDLDLEWAAQQLSSPIAQQAKMRLSMGHFPLYPIAQGRDRLDDFLAQGDAIHKLLETYDVHTHIVGHHHAYYPGRVGEVELLYSGALGVGPRSLLGTEDEQPMRTLTVMDIFFDATSAPQPFGLEVENEDDGNGNGRRTNGIRANAGLIQRDRQTPLEAGVATVYTTYNMTTLEVIDQSELPRVVAGPRGLVLRQDVNRRDLTYEDNLRYVRSW